MSEVSQYNEYKTIRPGLDIAVIGLAGRFPGAENIHEFWNNLKNGVESIAFLSDHELIEAGVLPEDIKKGNYVKAKGVLEDIEYFDASFFGYSPREAEKMDPQIRILHECAWHALEDGGYDPYTYKGAIGLYVGAQNNFHWQAMVFLAGSTSAAEAFGALNLVDKDQVSTRIAYKLNLTGPGFTLVTQCSTSLVALNQACHGLMSRECDMALAGGISITLPQKAGYYYQEGMIYSPDGHLRAFDARGKGTVFGNGAGIVLLKPIEDAIADGDNIMAIIKSSFVNNDGNRKVGYTAPSVEGQAEAIKAAIELAEVEPESIGYIETHGTATAIGDSIEIEALKLAFCNNKKHYCRIGTVKTNLGHLENAAGAAGLIKTILALKYRLIPPGLHYENPNPEIDFANSPFMVNTRLTEWKQNGWPLRAGVSSFGIGGTNAHVILEEWTGAKDVEYEAQCAGREYQLIVISAQTETALEKITGNLTQYFKNNPGINFADAAYTLQVGRRRSRCRKAFVCSSLEESIAALSAVENIKIFNSGTMTKPNVIFMFPGQGAQYINMGKELYQAEPVFRKEMNRCFEILKPLTGYDIKEILYPDDLTCREKEKGECNINRTEIAQPVLFVFEYALAKLLMSWGIHPAAMTGHSIGEYTAACLSGVFTLEDALKLVAARGQLMQQLPAGGMLGVPAAAGEILPLLPDAISLAAVNTPTRCVVSGPLPELKRLENQLLEKGYQCRRLHTSHAFHSRMMEPILDRMEKLAREVKISSPGIPYISNITGDWLQGREVASTGYWTDHLRQTVNFAGGTEKLLELEPAVFIEVGPGNVLSTFVQEFIEKKQHLYVIHLVRHPNKKIPDMYYLLENIGRFWLYGGEIDWNGFHPGQKRHRVSLSGYPFERERYWPENNPFKDGFSWNCRKSSPGKKPDISDWFYQFQWKRSRLLPPVSFEHLSQLKGKEQQENSCWLVFINETDFCSQLLKRLQQEVCDLILVEKGVTFLKKNQRKYSINPGQSEHYHMLLGGLQKASKIPINIVHLWNITGDSDEKQGKEMIDHLQDIGLYSLLYLVQAIAKKSFPGIININVVSNNIHEVIGDEILFPGKATVVALTRVVQQEITNIKCRCIDIELPICRGSKEEQLIEQIRGEFSLNSSDRIIAYRGNYRWIESYEPVHLEAVEVGKEIGFSRLRENGVYLITGGLGNIGFELAKFLARACQARLILTGRTVLPPRNSWETFLADQDHDKQNQVFQKIVKVIELEKLGAEVLVFSVDVADESQMKRVIDLSGQKWGPINAVIHAAGIVGASTSCPISRLKKEDFQEQFQAKVYGLLVLETLFKNRTLDFCLLISSLASILGGLGYAAYAAANIFMDAFVYRFNREQGAHSTQWLTINWGEWQSEENRGNEIAITAEEGVKTFQRALAYGNSSQFVISALDLRDQYEKWVKLETLEPPSGTGDNKTIPGSLKSRPQLTVSYAAPESDVEKKLAGIWSHFFGFKEIGLYDDFFELGGDSLKAISMISIIHKELELEIPLEIFFSGSTIKKLAGYIQSTPKSGYFFVEPAEKREYYPLSSSQTRLYVLHQLHKNSAGYNETEVTLFEGSLDMEKARRALVKLVKRHEILRTTIEMIAGKPVQRIHSKVTPTIEYIETHEDKARDLLRDFIIPFDLSRPPLSRFAFFKIAAGRYIFISDMHHIITDGVSSLIFFTEFRELYSQEAKELPGLKLQYKDYSHWQNSKAKQAEIREQKEFWFNEFKGGIPVLNLPYDFKRPAVQDFEGHRIHFDLSEEDSRALNELALKLEGTPYMVILAIYNVLLLKLSGQEDIVVGTDIAGRNHADFENIMGMFVNNLAMRNYPSGEKTFLEFLREVKERALKTFENQEFPFEDLVAKVVIERDPSRNPLFDVMFAFQNIGNMPGYSPGPEPPGIEIKEYQHEINTAKFDLSLIAIEKSGEIHFAFEYCKKLFKEETIKRFVDYFREIMNAVIDDPGKQILELDVINSAEKHELFKEVRDEIGISDIEGGVMDNKHADAGEADFEF